MDLAEKNKSMLVDEQFEKVCQHIELYKTDNIPIITEFLEF
jgi:hypothetical protein